MITISSPQSTCCCCCCPTLKGKHFRSLKELVSDYIEYFRPNAEEDYLSFKNLKTLDEAVEFAGNAKCPICRKTFSHQRKIPRKALENAKLMLSQLLPQIHNCRDFEELIKLFEDNIGKNIRGIGDLAIYDTALRIGAKLGIEPKVVYLHAGTTKGAKVLKEINKEDKFIRPSELPDEFKELLPREIEDCFCLYKVQLAEILKQT